MNRAHRIEHICALLIALGPRLFSASFDERTRAAAEFEKLRVRAKGLRVPMDAKP